MQVSKPSHFSLRASHSSLRSWWVFVDISVARSKSLLYCFEEQPGAAHSNAEPIVAMQCLALRYFSKIESIVVAAAYFHWISHLLLMGGALNQLYNI